MQPQLIAQLNQLNQQFYRTTAKAFDQTRQNPWLGWEELSPWLDQLGGEGATINALDLGCGNGRWQRFLLDRWPTQAWRLTSVDNSPDLLTKAADQTPVPPTAKCTWQQFDLVQTWLATENNELATFTQPPFDQKYDLITLFGVLHHLPSSQLRQNWLKKLAASFKPEGFLIFTYWRFDHEEIRFNKKAIDPSKLHIEPTQLEAGDLILDWRQGAPAYRYCHLANDFEIAVNTQLLQAAGLTLQTSFWADGKSGQLNQYQVWQLSKYSKT